jgi:hypothetical protein
MAGTIKRVSLINRALIESIERRQEGLVREMADLARERQAILDSCPSLNIPESQLTAMPTPENYERLLATIRVANAHFGLSFNTPPK